MRRVFRRLGLLVLVAPLAAAVGSVALVVFGDDEPSWESAIEALASEHVVFALNPDRVAALALPSGYEGAESLPLLIGLHDDGSFTWRLDRDLGLSERVSVDGFGLLLVNAEVGEGGERVWGASDDGYLNALVTEAGNRVMIGSVWIVGRGKGAIAAHRVACGGELEVSAVAEVSPPPGLERCGTVVSVEVGAADAAAIIAGLRERG